MSAKYDDSMEALRNSKVFRLAVEKADEMVEEFQRDVLRGSESLSKGQVLQVMHTAFLMGYSAAKGDK